MVPSFIFSVAWNANRLLFFSVTIGGCRSLFVSIISNAVLTFSLVVQIPCFCLLVWPLYVDEAEYGRYFFTSRALNPVHVENCLLLMDFSRVFW